MNKLIQLSLLLLLISTATAQESQSQNPPKVLRTYDWKDLNVQSTNCQIVSMEGMSVLKIESTNNPTPPPDRSFYPIYAPLEVSVLKITNSVITKTFWVSCEVKYENVWYGNTAHYNQDANDYNIIREDGGVLKLLAYFPPSASGGDERVHENDFDLRGTSNWQLYKFAVDRTKFESLPTKLELKISFAGHGTVYLRPIKLLGNASSSNWWSPQQIGLIGGIGGSVIGFFGGLLGLLASIGKARTFVLATMKIFIALGILLTIAGFVAVVSSQPYAVWYALLLPGVILTLVFSLTLPSIQRRYDELEIRRMTSVDAMGS
jgi:hypothetical protein